MFLAMKGKEQKFPILDRILRNEFGAEARFEIGDHEQVALLNETESLFEELSRGKELPVGSQTIEDLAQRINGVGLRANADGPLSEKALFGLARLWDFVGAVRRKGWSLHNEPD